MSLSMLNYVVVFFVAAEYKEHENIHNEWNVNKSH